mmetsp:Transcript_11498/g.21073  ORF Transcript_11498/g.21073 Transcript_11498/m.21073 type:complete len:208 (+) Transcript_11498:204-827(+)
MRVYIHQRIVGDGVGIQSTFASTFGGGAIVALTRSQDPFEFIIWITLVNVSPSRFGDTQSSSTRAGTLCSSGTRFSFCFISGPGAGRMGTSTAWLFARGTSTISGERRSSDSLRSRGSFSRGFPMASSASPLISSSSIIISSIESSSLTIEERLYPSLLLAHASQHFFTQHTTKPSIQQRTKKTPAAPRYMSQGIIVGSSPSLSSSS